MDLEKAGTSEAEMVLEPEKAMAMVLVRVEKGTLAVMRENSAARVGAEPVAVDNVSAVIPLDDHRK